MVPRLELINAIYPKDKKGTTKKKVILALSCTTFSKRQAFSCNRIMYPLVKIRQFHKLKYQLNHL